MRRFVVLLAVLTLLLIAVAPAGATPGGNGVQGIEVTCGDDLYVVNGVGIPGFPVDEGVGTAPSIQLFGGDFTFTYPDGSTESFTDDPPPGLMKAGKLVVCSIEADFFGIDVTIDPAYLKFPSA